MRIDDGVREVEVELFAAEDGMSWSDSETDGLHLRERLPLVEAARDALTKYAEALRESLE